MLGILHTSEEDSSIKHLEWQCIEPCKIEDKEDCNEKPKESQEETLVLEIMPVQVDGGNSLQNNEETTGELTQRMRVDAINNDNSIDIAMTGNSLYIS